MPRRTDSPPSRHRLRQLERELAECRKTVKSLEQGRGFFRTLVENSLDITSVVDPDGNLKYVTPSIERLFGYRPQELLGKSGFAFSHPDDLPRLVEEFAKIIQNPRVLGLTQSRFLHRDGTALTLQGVFMNLLDDPVINGILISARDVTKLKEAEHTLRQSRETSRVFMNALGDVALLLDSSGRFLEVNDTTARLLNRTPGELIGVSYLEVFPEDVAQRRKAYLDQAVRSREVVRFEDERQGIWFEHTLYPMRDERGQVTRIAVLARDVTARKLAELALRESERLYRLFVKTSPDALLIIDPNAVVLEVSERMIQTMGYDTEEQLLGRSGLEFMPAEDHPKARANILRTIERGYTVNQEYTLIRKDGSHFLGEISAVGVKDEHGHAKALVCSVKDVTAQKRITEELLKAQKLESIGILAGGIAHDFNNILTAILANLSMARIYGELSEETSKMLGDAETAAARAKNLTDQLLTFSTGGLPIKKTANLAKLIVETTRFALSGSNLKCEYQVAPDLWPVDMDEGQMSQVIQNLAINAKQAMPEGGVLRLRAENLVPGKKDNPPLRRGKTVRVSITDQGTGIPAKHLDKVFDPFFTTKHEGRGLGLAICYSIVKNHGGRIEVDSTIGAGTTFHVTLPASKTVPAAEPRGREPPPKGSGRILLIDDEELVRRATGQVLRRLGYEVASAENGPTGLRLYKKEMKAGRRFDLVVLDLTIPGGPGAKGIMRGLLKIDPRAKVIAASGYVNDPIMLGFSAYGFCGVLCKPYELGEISAAIQKALARS